MSGHATSAFANLAADNHFDGDDKQTLLSSGGRDAETLSENDDRRMSQVGQPTERRNGKGTRGGITPHAAGPTESDSDSDEEQQNQLTQLPDGRDPRRWITETEWTRYIQEDRLRNRPSRLVSIFRVPKSLKDIKKEAYVPQTVSLGPLHHGSAELPPMGHHKGRALHRMMTRFNNREALHRRMTSFNNRDVVIEPNNMDFANRAMKEILELENKIRDSYEENIDCTGKTLAWMLTLDGCFLLEVLRTVGGYGAPVAEAMERYDPIFGENKLGYAAGDIMFDILMLENQIPLVVLRKLLELELNSAVDAEELLLDVLVRGTSLFSSFRCINNGIERRPVKKEVHHLLGFLHSVIVSPPSSTQDERVDQGERRISIDCCISECIRMLQGKSKAQNEAQSIPHATELRNAGIEFSPLQTGGIKAIRFEQKRATIFLPPLCIMDDTVILFRNLIAFEMCKPSRINYVTRYVSLMDDLIDSDEDVALMRRMGVLTHGLGSDKEVADLFNGLCKRVTVSTANVFDNLTEQVNAHYNNKMKVHFAKLAQDHFSSPWKALALAAAVVLLLLAAVQTIFSIISVYKSP